MAIEGRTRDVPPIKRDAVYTIAQFCRATGMGRTGLRHAERRGLETYTDGGRKYISGEAYYEYLRRLANQGGRSDG